MRRTLLWPVVLAAGCSSAATPAHPAAPEVDMPPHVTSEGRPAAPPDNDAMAKLARTDPVAFLQHALRRYERDVQGYRCLLVKTERVNGRLLSEERVRSSYREKPYSVLMVWEKGAGKASRTLYVEGENDGKLLAKPSGLLSLTGTWSRRVDDADAVAASRYPITQFGLKAGMRRTLAAWQAAQKRGDLKVIFHGEESPPQYGGRPCWKLQRVGYPAPEDGGVTESTFWFDKESWLQTGSYVTGEGGQLVGRYAFLELELNPAFDADTFTPKALTRR